jgi:arylsulfatase A-like enzyme
LGFVELIQDLQVIQPGARCFVAVPLPNQDTASPHRAASEEQFPANYLTFDCCSSDDVPMSFRCLLAGLLAFGFAASARAAGVAEHAVVIVWDGMRPDCVTPELTPTLWQLRTNGVWFARHHPVFPSITEANGPALATGDYPRQNDIIADSEYRPAINTNRAVGMENFNAIRKGDELSGNRFLAVPTLSEILQQRGFRTAVAGSKTVALLADRLERKSDDPRGLVLFPNATLPAALWPQLTNRFGSPPPGRNPNTARDEWTTRCLIEGLWEKGVPKYSLLWMSEPDSSQHNRGIGLEPALESIRGLDRNLALVLRELERRGERAKTDVIVTSDHGFSTIMASIDNAGVLRRADVNARRQFQGSPAEGDTLVVGNAGSVLIYVTGHKKSDVQKAVTALQHQPTTGTIFTRNGLPGTFPLKEARLDSAHAPDIVISMSWQSGSYTNRLPGLIYDDGTGRNAGKGTHATLSPTDMHSICVANGPDFRAGLTNNVPTGTVDITPTLLWLFGIQPPRPTDGRVLFETLASTKGAPPKFKERKLETRVKLTDGVWTQYLSISEVKGVRYLDEGNGQFTSQSVSNSPPARAANP